MKKLFISQPMRYKTDKEILKERELAVAAAKELLDDKDIEVIDSFVQGVTENGNPLWCLAEAIKHLADADVVYFAPGWEQSRGCKIEYQCALEYNIDIINKY